MQFKYAYFEKETRYYTLLIIKDLLGDWLVIRNFGRRGSRSGKSIKEIYITYGQALERFENLVFYRQRKRKYQLTWLNYQRFYYK